MKKKQNKYLIRCDEDTCWNKFPEDMVEITEDDYGLILDALYEQAMANKKYSFGNVKETSYSRALIKVAKKFEKVFKEVK